jgi:putative heme iron utilization protein
MAPQNRRSEGLSVYDEFCTRSHKLSVKTTKHARELLLKEYQGVLSTHSKAMPGFPFGSAVPYCLDDQGRPLLLISRIAQHTHNVQMQPKCSLLVGPRGAEDVQAAGRLTLLAEAQQLVDEAQIAAAAERYYRYFPTAQNYHQAHDFDFWRLEPVRWRYIGGFGAIHWLDNLSMLNPFAGEVEQSMLTHMNNDHAKAIAHYVALNGLPAEPAAQMVGLSSEGLHIRIGRVIHWLAFAEPCCTPLAVRQALVALARAEIWPTDGVSAA